MGSRIFLTLACGESAEVAFREARENAQHEHGHGGYTGTIAEKGGFRLISDTAPQARTILERSLAQLSGPGASVLDEGARSHLAERLAHFNCESPKRAQDPQGLAFLVAQALLDADDQRVDDKYGPAGCIVVREPDVLVPLSKARAEALARKRFGERASIETGRRSGLYVATLWVEQPTPGIGVNHAIPGGYRFAARMFAGRTLGEARGRLFCEPGQYLFFGWAAE